MNILKNFNLLIKIILKIIIFQIELYHKCLNLLILRQLIHIFGEKLFKPCKK